MPLAVDFVSLVVLVVEIKLRFSNTAMTLQELVLHSCSCCRFENLVKCVECVLAEQYSCFAKQNFVFNINYNIVHFQTT